MGALITTRYLMRAPHLRKHPDVNVLNVGTRDPDWNHVLRLARGGACVATNAARMVDYFCPLHGFVASWLFADHDFRNSQKRRERSGKPQARMPAFLRTPALYVRSARFLRFGSAKYITQSRRACKGRLKPRRVYRNVNAANFYGHDINTNNDPNSESRHSGL